MKTLLEKIDNKIAEIDEQDFTAMSYWLQFREFIQAQELGWISVKDRLPDFDKQVLVYCRIYGRYIASYNFIGNAFGKDWGNWHDGKVLGVLPPTHWMPLPEPPKQ